MLRMSFGIRMPAQEIRHHAKARHERRIVGAERQRIGLERLEAGGLHLGAELLDVVERADRLHAEFLLEEVLAPDAEAAAMRPVKIDAVAERPAEQLVDRHAERLGLDVEAGVLDRRDRFVVDAADRHAGDRAQRHRDVADLARVHADGDVGKAARSARWWRWRRRSPRCIPTSRPGRRRSSA